MLYDKTQEIIATARLFVGKGTVVTADSVRGSHPSFQVAQPSEAQRVVVSVEVPFAVRMNGMDRENVNQASGFVGGDFAGGDHHGGIRGSMDGSFSPFVLVR